MTFLKKIFSMIAQQSLRYRIGQFTGSGVVHVPLLKAPEVRIDGIGTLGSPLPPQQAAALISGMQQAPFGIGFDTIVDTDVRNCWQLDADQVSLNPRWTYEVLPDIVKEACEKLGLDATSLGVQAHLYKLICYEPGGHFKTHRDTEKEPGMFATLIVQLPSAHKGGDLVVQHRGEQARFQFATGSENSIRYAAIYADCEHTLEPLTEGVRLVLAYNLVRTKADQGLYPQAGEQQASRSQLSNAMKTWASEICQSRQDAADKATANTAATTSAHDPSTGSPTPPLPPQKLAYLLEHKYTLSSLSFDGLKGADRTLVQALRGLREEGKGDDKKKKNTPVPVEGQCNTIKSSTSAVDGGFGAGHNEPLLDVYLCLIERNFVDPSTENGKYKHYEYTSIALWIGEEGTPVDMPYMGIDLDTEILDNRRPYGEKTRVKGVELRRGEKLLEIEDADDGKQRAAAAAAANEGGGAAAAAGGGGGIAVEEEKRKRQEEGEDAACLNDGTSWAEWDDDNPDKKDIIGYMGNDGCSAETWYYTAAIVFWPRSEAFRMVSEAGGILRLAELTEEAVARGAPYVDKYVTGMIDMLLDKNIRLSAMDRPEDKAAGRNEDPLQTIINTVFNRLTTVDQLVRAIRATIVRSEVLETFDQMQIADLVTRASVRILSLTTHSSSTSSSTSSSLAIDAASTTNHNDNHRLGESAAATTTAPASASAASDHGRGSITTLLGDGLETAVNDLLTAGRIEGAVDLVLSIRAEGARKRFIVPDRDTSNISSLMAPIAERLAQVIANHVEGKGADFLLPADDKNTGTTSTTSKGNQKIVSVVKSNESFLFLPLLASFRSCIPLLERVAIATGKELTFSQYTSIAETVLAARPREPPMLLEGHSAIAVILGRCPAALAREISPDVTEVAWMYWALLQLSQLQLRATARSGGFTLVLESYDYMCATLASAIKDHPQCETLLQRLLANVDVQEAVRRGDDVSRSLCELRVQQLTHPATTVVSDTAAGDVSAPPSVAYGTSMVTEKGEGEGELQMLQQLLLEGGQ